MCYNKTKNGEEMIAIILNSLDDPIFEDNFRNFYQKYNKLSFKVANAYLENSYDAEEAVQSVFIAFAKHFSKINDMSDEQKRAYITKATKNHSRNLLTRRKHEIKTVDLDKCLEISSEIDTHAELENAEKLGIVLKIIMEMPEKHRDVLLFRISGGFSYSEIADFMNMSVNDVKNNLHNAKKHLKKRMGELYDE